MREDGKYILGTVEEIAKYITEQSFGFDDNGNTVNARQGKFKDFDFAIAEVTPVCGIKEPLSEVYANSSGWSGIKQITTGFDNDYSIDLFGDYCGGGCGVYKNTSEDFGQQSMVETILEMIIEIIETAGEYISKNTLLIVEVL